MSANELTYTVTLLSDGEPGTGLGAELANDFAPRTETGRFVLRASHIKGLMRRELEAMAPAVRGKDAEAFSFADRVLGRPGEQPEGEQVEGARFEGDDGEESAFSMTDAVAADSGANAPKPLMVSRTAIDEATGRAKGETLRTTEAVPAGTVFEGKAHIRAGQGAAEDLAVRLALLSISAVGGGRTRGAGKCLVEIKDETRTPGQLLNLLADALSNPAAPPVQTGSGPSAELGEGVRLLRLVFRADSPICCPENPVVGLSNVIKSSFSISSAAVQGAVLHRLGQVVPALADALYADGRFRAWPLLPCALPDAKGALPGTIRVSLTHRVRKLSEPKQCTEEDFFEEAVEPYDMADKDARDPLKAADGVLLKHADGGRMLWKSAHMPRVVTAHAVLRDRNTPDGRNLFSMESMAPLVWTGWLAMPSKAADVLMESLKGNSRVAFGRGRSVRGGGELVAEAGDGFPLDGQTGEYTVLVAQSPLILPQTDGQSAHDELQALALDWAMGHSRLPMPGPCWCLPGVRFGWNRHGKGDKASGRGANRLCAERVALPGSVIRLEGKADPESLKSALLAGFGPGRERGFGALAVHPGKAQGLFKREVKLEELRSGKLQQENQVQLVKWAIGMADPKNPLPSRSQIAAVRERLIQGGKPAALDHLKRQKDERPPRIWASWRGIFDDVERVLGLPEKDAVMTLDILANLADLRQKKGDKR